MKCTTEFLIEEHGVGLAQTGSLLGISLASVASMMSSIIGFPVWLDVVAIILAIAIGLRLAILWSVRVTPVEERSIEPMRINSEERLN